MRFWFCVLLSALCDFAQQPPAVALSPHRGKADGVPKMAGKDFFALTGFGSFEPPLEVVTCVEQEKAPDRITAAAFSCVAL